MNSPSEGAPPLAADVANHYASMQQTSALCDLGDRTQLELRGRDCQRFLNNLCTNDIVKLAPGTGCEAFATNVQGKCLGHLFVFQSESATRVSTVPGQAERLLAHWDRYLITEDVRLSDLTPSRSEWLLAGPTADDVLTRLDCVPVPVSDFAHQSLSLLQQECWVQRVPLLAVPAYLLSVPRAAQAEVGMVLSHAGAAHTDSATARAALECARIEHRFPWYGRDITDKVLPQEVQRDATAISFKKGCYLGQETIARIDALGHVNRVLSLIRCESDTAPSDGTSVFWGEQPVGEITSAAFSPQHERPLALAYLRCAAASSGTPVRVGATPGTVV